MLKIHPVHILRVTNEYSERRVKFKFVGGKGLKNFVSGGVWEIRTALVERERKVWQIAIDARCVHDPDEITSDTVILANARL